MTRKLFREWRSPRLGRANPERMNNPVWEWLVRSQLTAYGATRRLKGPSALKAGPGWCFQRFGQSSTHLPDGRQVLVAGEHEDSYDPDFYIYNDVVVRHPDGRMDIFGYPREIFPPTDFHSATVVGDRLVLIGSLGYPEHRRPGTTQVLALDLASFTISPIQTTGVPPGWIHRHTAALSEDGDSILIQHGQLDRGGDDRSLVENLDDWRLHLADWRWERLTERRWPQWEVRRQDGELNHLFEIQQALWSQQIPGLATASGPLEQFKRQFNVPSLEEELGGAPDLDLFARLYRPCEPHEPLPQGDDAYGVHRIRVAGVVVRYVQDMQRVQMTVEGDLPPQTVQALAQDLLEKMSALENAPCELVRL